MLLCSDLECSHIVEDKARLVHEMGNIKPILFAKLENQYRNKKLSQLHFRILQSSMKVSGF